MFVNISPLAKHYNESVSSLRFAQKVNGCLSSNKRGLPGERMCLHLAVRARTKP